MRATIEAPPRAYEGFDPRTRHLAPALNPAFQKTGLATESTAEKEQKPARFESRVEEPIIPTSEELRSLAPLCPGYPRHMIDKINLERIRRGREEAKKKNQESLLR